MGRMLEAYLAFARGDTGEQSAPTDMADVPRRAQGRRRAQRPPGHGGVLRPSDRHGEARGVQALPRQSGVERRALCRHDRHHRPPRSSLAHRHGRRRRPGHSGERCARRCSSRSCGSTTRATRTRAAPAWGLRSPATSRARTAATSRSATARSAACARRCGCRLQRLRLSRRRGLVAGSRRGGRARRQRLACGSEFRNAAQIVEQSRPALAARQLAVERRDACARGLHRRRRPRCGARWRTAAPGPARGSRPRGRRCRCRRRPASTAASAREAVERKRERRIARAERRASGPPPCAARAFEPAHQHVEQALARGFLRHVGIVAGQHLAIDLLDLCGQHRKRGAELRAKLGQRNAGRDATSPRPIPRTVVGEQRHEGLDHPLARGAFRADAAGSSNGAACNERFDLRAMMSLLRTDSIPTRSWTR